MAAQAQLGSMVRPDPFRTVSLIIDISFAEARIHRDILYSFALPLGPLHSVELFEQRLSLR